MKQTLIISGGKALGMVRKEPDSFKVAKDFDGKQKISRYTEIKFSSEKQLWYVVFKLSPLAGKFLTQSIWDEYTGNHHTGKRLTEKTEGGVFLFSEYEDAVGYEVFMIETAFQLGKLNFSNVNLSEFGGEPC